MPHKFDPTRRARLEDPERARLLPPEDLLRRAGLRAGMRMADVGCGPGFFTLPAAAIVGKTGRVFAIDISEEMLEADRAKAAGAGLENIQTLHEAVDSERFAREVSRILAPGGRVLLLEWEKRETPMGQPLAERLAPEIVHRWLAAAGLTVEERFSPNPQHYGVVATAAS